jgi:hypothetical protein
MDMDMDIKMRTIKDMWDTLLITSMPPDAPQVQVAEMRKAFYMGASAMLTLQAVVLGREDTTNELASQAMYGWDSEITEFRNEFK